MNPINLSFAMESSASLWNIVFTGFDQEVILISKFEGKKPNTIHILNKFGDIIEKSYKDCKVVPIISGIAIKKQFPRNDTLLLGEWTKLMQNMSEEISRLLVK